MDDEIKVLVLKIKLRAPWVHSLKEKRMIVKSLLSKVRNQFHVSAAEVGEQDLHQILVIGVASITAHNAQADSMTEEILRFVERSTEAEVLDVEKEVK